MDKELKQVILQILTIIDYADDKDAFAVEFLQLMQQKALVSFLRSLPQDKQETYNKIVSDTLRDAFVEYAKAIRLTLSEEQKQKLQQYLNSFVKTSTF